MNVKTLLMPPFAFLIILAAGILMLRLFARCSFRSNKQQTEGSKKSYACGEDFNEHMIQPDYSSFFPFAFFFTILHVVALVIATLPLETNAVRAIVIAVIFLSGAVIGLLTLLREVED
ncbi:MAG: hypothetical protein NTV07_06835 [Candidatus Omnitrophica bacterium]|nr:hypothetical protein [Candidatus Omnitrophota bacterium]